MKPIVKGMFARSLAGHDKGRLYVISDVQEPYVFLVDGKIRTANRPKKKKLIHVQPDDDRSVNRSTGGYLYR